MFIQRTEGLHKGSKRSCSSEDVTDEEKKWKREVENRIGRVKKA